MDKVKIRPAEQEDIPGLLWMIQLLGEYLKQPHALKIGEKELLRDGFGQEKYFHCLVAELTCPPEEFIKAKPPGVSALAAEVELPSQKMQKNEKFVGYALYFSTYSTWEGRMLYMEDLCIRMEYRNLGIGTALMRECAKVAMAKDCTRMQWQVFDWNTEALKLYERTGGKCLREWLTIRMDKLALAKFAAPCIEEIKDRVKIRPAEQEDIPGLLWMIQLLGEYEKEPHALKIGEKELLRDGFGQEKYFHCLVAELTCPPEEFIKAKPPGVSALAGEVELPSQKMQKNEKFVGYALYFSTYSALEGRMLYMEDLCVRMEYRNLGIGTALMRECAKVAMAKDCTRMQWQVLDWNTEALKLYERMGGKCLRELLTIRMDKSALAKFAAGEADTSTNS